MGNKLKQATVEFNGFLLVAVAESWYDAMPYSPLGKFKVSFSYHYQSPLLFTNSALISIDTLSRQKCSICTSM